MNRQQRRRLKNIVIALSLVIGLTLFAKHQLRSRVPRQQSDGISNMLNLAKKAALKRQSSTPLVHLSTSDFDIPDDPELARVDKILKNAEEFRKSKQAAAQISEEPESDKSKEQELGTPNDAQLKMAIEKIGEMLMANGLKRIDRCHVVLLLIRA